MAMLTIQPEAIIEGCLIGLGLVIAVYTLVYPKIESVLDKKAKRVVELEKKFNEESSTLSRFETNKDKRNQKIEDLKKINEEIKTEYLLPYELYAGFILTMVFFTLPLLVYAFPLFDITILKFFESYTLNFFFLGVLSFAILFFLIFIRLHTMVMNEFDKRIEKVREETNKKLEDIKGSQ